MDVVHLRARVGMVFQKPNLFPKSIFENVAYGPRIHGLAKDKHELEQIVHEACSGRGLKEVRIACSSRERGCRADSNSGCVSPARSPCSRKSS